MYIDKNGLNPDLSSSESVSMAQVPETSETASNDDPGYAPISPDTPSWGPPPASSDSNDPGFAPISPDTPSWGPPSSFPDSTPSTPPWRPPVNNPGNGSNSTWRPPVGGTIIRPVIVVPGQSGSGSSSSSRSANIRFLHAAANQPAVNIRLGNRTVINNMQFGNFTPYYLDSGSQNTMVTITNAQTGQTLYRRSISFSDGTAYTVSIINDGSGITLFTLTDSPCNNRFSGCLRAVNLSPNSGAVDVFLSGYGRIFQGLNQLDVSRYRSINQGTYYASVSEALPCTGSNASIIMGNGYVECNNTRIVVMNTSTINVMNGVTYTLYIIGRAYQFPSLQILALESDLIY